MMYPVPRNKFNKKVGWWFLRCACSSTEKSRLLCSLKKGGVHD